MGKLAGNIIWLVHAAFMLWVVLAPFLGSIEQLLLHAIIVPCMCLHWLVNDDTCALTVLESWLRGVPATDSLFHALASPVYKMSESQWSTTAWCAASLLWTVTMYKLNTKHRGEVADLCMHIKKQLLTTQLHNKQHQ
jgi:hypothetical protein